MTAADRAVRELVSTSARKAGFNAGWPARAELHQLCFEADVHDGWPARAELRERYPEPDPTDAWTARAELSAAPAAGQLQTP